MANQAAVVADRATINKIIEAYQFDNAVIVFIESSSSVNIAQKISDRRASIIFCSGGEPGILYATNHGFAIRINSSLNYLHQINALAKAVAKTFGYNLTYEMPKPIRERSEEFCEAFASVWIAKVTVGALLDYLRHYPNQEVAA